MKAEDIKPNKVYSLVNNTYGTSFTGRLGKSKYISGPYLTGRDGNGVRCHLPLKNLHYWEERKDV